MERNRQTGNTLLAAVRGASATCHGEPLVIGRYRRADALRAAARFSLCLRKSHWLGLLWFCLFALSALAQTAKPAERLRNDLPRTEYTLALQAGTPTLPAAAAAPTAQPARAEWREVAAFFGFLLGTVIFAILVVLLLRDVRALRQRRRRDFRLWAALSIAAAALAWNGWQLAAVVAQAFGNAAAFAASGWQQSTSGLLLALAPILIGLLAAYRLYKATFMDILLKRGLALVALFVLALLYGKVIEAPAALVLQRVSNEALRGVLLTTLWLGVYAVFPFLRDQLNRLVDRHLFKRRDYARLLDDFAERLREVPDEPALLAAACAAVRAAFAAESVRHLPQSETLAQQLTAATRASVLLRRQVESAALEATLAELQVELVLILRSGATPNGVILVGPRAFGQSYLSEELSVLRAVAAEIGRTLENLQLNAARRQQAIEEEELRKLVAQSELMALRAQINPHFFFNALNSVAALIAENPPRAEALLENLAELFRRAFKPSTEIIPLWQELEMVETYLEVERVRLGDRLHFVQAVLPEALDVNLPALTIQPLVENAVQHGLGKLKAGGALTLSASVRNGQLHIVVADTGAGIPAAELPQVLTRGVGLSNANSRLLRLCGPAAKLRLDSTPGQGTTVSFSIPATLAATTPAEPLRKAVPAA
jgi:signal transduction histidine kinase